MRIALSVRDSDDQSRDFLVDAEPEHTVRDIVRRFGADGAGAADQAPTVVVDGRAVDLDSSLLEAGLVDGAVVDLRAGADANERRAGLVDLGVAGGRGAGRMLRLGPGEHVITGLAPVPDGSLVVQVDVRGRVRVRAGSAQIAARLSGGDLGAEFVEWPPGAPLLLGDSVLATRAVADADAVLERVDDGSSFDFNRPPRGIPAPAKSEFRIPAPPEPLPTNPLPWLGALVPVVGAVVTALVFGNVAFLAIAAVSPIVVVVNWLTARRRGRRSQSTLLAEYEITLAQIQADIDIANTAERAAMAAAAPSALDLHRIAVSPESRLWERRSDDDDYLQLRVGVSDLPSSVVVDDAREEMEYRRRLPSTLVDAPMTLSLKSAGVIGVAGAREHVQPLAEWFLAQTAVLQSPRDAQLVLLSAGSDEERWSWTAWLPHLSPAFGQDSRAVIGNDAETIGRRVAELGRILAERQAQAAEVGGRNMRLGPDVVVFWDGARRLRSYPGAAAILRDGPSVGIFSVCVDESERALPEEATAVVIVHDDGGADVRGTPQDVNHKTRLDVVDQSWFEEVARAIAPIRDAGDDEDDALPHAARLTEVLELEPVEAKQLLTRWTADARSTRATLGVSFDGPFAIDLVSDGPHGLIAGTTGSGKSELLQTIVAGLAVVNRPDAMNFVLVDYKGGAAFKDAVHLPHTVGMVTDLDAHLVERALTSLGAELTRREHMLAAVGAKDIEDYFDARTRHAAEPMPRLLIVIDEFASMVRELPDFVTGLVNIAQRGRSLGIHLILATQRPSGVVSADIRANTNLRISLRVTDAADSADVIGTSDAAQIAASTPGRAYVRLGHSSLVPFQSARVGGRSPITTATKTLPPPFVAPLSWAGAGYPLPAAPRSEGRDGEHTDLTRLVDAAREAAGTLNLPANHSPWLPALPDSVLREDVLETSLVPSDDPALPAVAWALGDVPAEQAQRPIALELTRFGHLFIAGSARSGRSQALRTIAGGLADAISTADLHLFGIDMGNGALLPLTRLPHTGAVVQRSERERLTRLFDRLLEEMTRRQELFGRLGVADIGEQRRQAEPGDRLPHLVVLLDRWENFVSSYGDIDGGAYIDRVLAFLREGAGVGIHLILTGDRSLLSGRMSVLTDDKWVLRFADRGDYGMADLNPRKLPERIPDGRILRAGSGQEAQIALLAPDPTAAAQADALAAIAASAQERDRGIPVSLRPMRVDLLPSALTWDEAIAYPGASHDSSLWAMIGVGGDELTAMGIDLGGGASTFLIAGPPRSGRSNLLGVTARSIRDSGAELVLVLPKRSPLEAMFAGAPGVRAVFTGVDLPWGDLETALSTASGPVALIVDDGELLRDASELDFLRGWMRVNAGAGGAVVLAGNAADVGGGFSGWQTDIRNNQRGALLSPRNPFDGDLLGVRLSRSLTNGPVAAGRALVHFGDGELITLQVPQIVE